MGNTVLGAGEPVRKSVDSTPFVVTPLNSASILPGFFQCCAVIRKWEPNKPLYRLNVHALTAFVTAVEGS